MRSFILVTLALAGLAALPLVAGDTCVPSCDVSTAAQRLFVPAASVVQSGSTLGWLAGDNLPHTATDLETGCFHTSFGTIARGTVLFFVDAGALYASSEGDEPQPCAVAPLPNGAFLLEYTCLLHPEMDGNILVIQ